MKRDRFEPVWWELAPYRDAPTLTVAFFTALFLDSLAPAGPGRRRWSVETRGFAGDFGDGGRA